MRKMARKNRRKTTLYKLRQTPAKPETPAKNVEPTQKRGSFYEQAMKLLAEASPDVIPDSSLGVLIPPGPGYVAGNFGRFQGDVK
jgi:hypothetical protein